MSDDYLVETLRTYDLTVCREAADEIKRLTDCLAAAEAELHRLKATQCQWCRGGFDAGD